MSTLEAVADINDQVTSALRDMVELINNKDDTIKNLEEQINTLSKNNYEYENSELTKERDNLKNNVLNLAKKVEDHDAKIIHIHAAYKKEIKRLEANWFTTDKLHNEKKEVIDSLHKETLELKSDVHTLKLRLQKATTSNLALTNENSILEKEKETNLRLTSERNTLATKNKNLNDNYSTIINRNNEIHKELDDKKLTIESLRTFNTKATIKIQKLSSDCIVLNEQNSKKAETIKRMSAEFNSMSIAKSALDVEIQRLETKKQAEIDELTKEISQLKDKLLEIMRQSTDHRLLHEKCAASKQFLQEDYDTLEEHSTKLENEIKDLKAKLDNITSLLD